MKLSLEEVAALLGNKSSGDNLSQLMLLKLFEKDDKKDDKKEDKDKDKPVYFLGFEIKRTKKESRGSVFLWALLVVLAFSPYISILQDWLEKSLRAALQ